MSCRQAACQRRPALASFHQPNQLASAARRTQQLRSPCGAALQPRRGCRQLPAALPPLRQAPPGRPARRVLVRPQAGLYSLPSDLYGSLQTGCGIALLMALGFSALPILTGDSKEQNERRYNSPDADESAENIRWSVMGVLSVLPFINPMAWVFAALDDDDSSALYYSLAVLYTLPYLANGFELDGFALVSLLVCILHIQVERVARTEPVEVELPSVLRRLLAGLPRAVRSLGRYSRRLGSEVGSRASSAEAAARRRPDRKYLEERSREARAELEEFDRRRRERQAQQQQQWQAQQQQELREQEEAQQERLRLGGRQRQAQLELDREREREKEGR